MEGRRSMITLMAKSVGLNSERLVKKLVISTDGVSDETSYVDGERRRKIYNCP